MKIRNGFVSNSSSSSFVLIVKKEDFDKVYGQLKKKEKKVIDHIDSETINAFDNTLIKMIWQQSNEGSSSFYNFNFDDKNIDVLENWEEIQEAEDIMYKIVGKLRNSENIYNEEQC